MVKLVPPAIKEFLQELKSWGVPAPRAEFSEEEQTFPLTFSEEKEYTPVEVESWEPITVSSEGEETVFTAFLDGVQRTMMLPYRILLPSGAQVPLHVAHIAAGVLLRDESGRLHMESDLIAARLLLLGPFQGIQRAGGITFESGNLMWDTSDQTFALPNELNEWIICDTTFRGTEEDRSERREGALLGNELFKEGLIRSRAQGRVATLRQRLEFAVLAKFREKYRDTFILMDGPLFFIDKWRRRAAKVLGLHLGELSEAIIEDTLLKNAVGLIKTHRLRPKHPEQVVRIGPDQRSPVVRISEEVDVKGRRGKLDEEGGYGGAHLTWYTRLRSPWGSTSYGLQGLIRLDIHRATLGVKLADALNPETFRQYKPEIDKITRAVWRERWPRIGRSGDLRSSTQIYPVEQLEKVLRARLYPRRLLVHFFNISSS